MSKATTEGWTDYVELDYSKASSGPSPLPVVRDGKPLPYRLDFTEVVAGQSKGAGGKAVRPMLTITVKAVRAFGDDSELAKPRSWKEYITFPVKGDEVDTASALLGKVLALAEASGTVGPSRTTADALNEWGKALLDCGGGFGILKHEPGRDGNGVFNRVAYFVTEQRAGEIASGVARSAASSSDADEVAPARGRRGRAA